MEWTKPMPIERNKKKKKSGRCKNEGALQLALNDIIIVEHVQYA